MTRSEYLDAINSVTGIAEWGLVKEGLMADINSLISQELSSDDFGEIKELRGFRRALEYVHNLREIAKTEKAQQDAVYIEDN